MSSTSPLILVALVVLALLVLAVFALVEWLLGVVADRDGTR